MAQVRMLLGALTANSDPAALQALLALSQDLGDAWESPRHHGSGR